MLLAGLEPAINEAGKQTRYAPNGGGQHPLAHILILRILTRLRDLKDLLGAMDWCRVGLYVGKKLLQSCAVKIAEVASDGVAAQTLSNSLMNVFTPFWCAPT